MTNVEEQKGRSVTPQAAQTSKVQVKDGTEMTVHVARPAGPGPHPAMLVFQEAFGVNAHIRDVAGRFADLGFVAAAPEIFHRTGPGFEGSYTDFESVRPHTSALTTASLQADVRAAHDLLTGDPTVRRDRIACIGFCLGGRVSFIAAATVPLRAAVSFYGNMGPDVLALAGDVNAPFMMFWGGLDKHIQAEQRRSVADALERAGKTFSYVEFSKADHGFFNDARNVYEPNAAGQAWALVKEFLRQNV
jgi:carboxymethylenebutenolidase